MLKIAVSLTPVFLFLLVLIFIDSYKLVKIPAVLMAIFAGVLSAFVCLLVNNLLLEYVLYDTVLYSRYLAPVVEESIKAIYLGWLLRTNRVGFMVDAAIYGFAIGAGFAFIENIYYLQALTDTQLAIWFIRGFGTALMHGCTVAVFAIWAKGMLERHPKAFWRPLFTGLLISIGLHALYNHFVLPPLLSTLSLLILLPIVILFIFERSEKATQNWLGIGFDSDVELLAMIEGGNIAETKIGRYLNTMKMHFPGELVVDMLCLLRLHLELAVRAKGILMLKKTGLPVQPDLEIREKFIEMRYLKKNLGKTGMLAIMPLLRTSSRDLWQIYMLDKS